MPLTFTAPHIPVIIHIFSDMSNTYISYHDILDKNIIAVLYWIKTTGRNIQGKQRGLPQGFWIRRQATIRYIQKKLSLVMCLSLIPHPPVYQAAAQARCCQPLQQTSFPSNPPLPASAVLFLPVDFHETNLNVQPVQFSIRVSVP